ncbi:MAG TPA: MBL fold metallo-hydrolase [Trebonia sp.]|nr:MBL fold metallo-hydrolase [Trebonia sp.]
MLRQVAQDVWIHKSDFMQSNAVVVQGGAGVLLIDAGIRGDELAGIASDLRELRQPVAAGFSTHPHWDHLLWQASLGTPPRYGTARCAAVVAGRLSNAGWQAAISGMIPPDILEQVPLDDLFGRITALPAGTAYIPWDGPRVRIVEHQAHAPGHAALLVEERGVLVAGDMLSDILIPMLNVLAPDPVEEYLAALRLIEGMASEVEVVIPGHGSVGGGDELRARIDRDRAYLDALRAGRTLSDARLGPAAAFGSAMTGVHNRQLQYLA